ncbi:MAG: carbohydrate ABC transporter permease [bacterium]
MNFISTILILPFLVVWFLFNLVSIGVGVWVIFQEKGIIESFKFIFRDPLFWISLKNSFLYGLVVIPVQLFSFMIAFLIYRLESKMGYFFRTILYLPVVVPIASIAFVFKVMFNDEGIVNNFLSNFLGLKVPFLSNFYYAMLVAFLLTLWKGLGYYVIIYLSGLYSISREVVEVSIIDSMNGFQRLIWVYIPMLRGTFYFASFLSLLAALKVFAEIFIITEGGPGTSTYTLMMYIYSRAFYSFDLSTAIAASFVLSFFAILISLLVFRKQLESFKFS